jgi:hypothetical protein
VALNVDEDHLGPSEASWLNSGDFATLPPLGHCELVVSSWWRRTPMMKYLELVA